MMPVFAANIHIKRHYLPLGGPIHEKLFGKNKTYRGFYAGYIGALIMLFLQYYLQKNGIFTEYILLDYEKINLFLYAFLFGIGALTGDLIKSFFKRRLNIAPGKPFIPFDQIDFVLGAWLFLLPFYPPPWQNLLAVLIIMPFLHFLTNIIGYFLGLKKVWW